MESTFIRPAGNSERRCVVREALGLYGSVVIAAYYRLPGHRTKSDLEDLLRPAIAKCQQQHPVLNGICFQEIDSERPSLARTAKTFPNISLWTSSERTEAEFIASSTSHSCLRNDVLPWRINVWLANSSGDDTVAAIAFVASHAFADGRSGYIFHQSLNAALNHKAVETPLSNLPRPLELAGKLTISASFLLGPVIQEYSPSFLLKIFGSSQDSGRKMWVGSPIRPKSADHEESPQTNVHMVTLSETDLSRVLNRCRKEKARLTGLVSHVVSRSLCVVLREMGHDTDTFVAATAFDLRGVLARESNNVQVNDAIGVYASGKDETIHFMSGKQNELDWESIRLCTIKLEKASTSLANQAIGLLKYLSDYKSWIIKKAANAAESSFGMSNLGVLSCVDELSPEKVVFAQSGDKTGEAFNVNLASVKGGPLSIALTWWPGMLGVEDEQRFMERVTAGILQRLQSL